MKILALCDTPTVQTGFGRVAQNLLRRWHHYGAKIDVWGINYAGWPHELPYRIFPATSGELRGWSRTERLEAFLTRLRAGFNAREPYDIVWMMQDLHGLSAHKFPEALAEVAGKVGAKTAVYFPVDAPLDAQWTDMVKAVDLPVAYTQYGAREVVKHWPAGKDRLHILPHGVETRTYFPMPEPERSELRQKLWAPADWVKPDDLLMINVNANQPRKDVSRSLVILRDLIKMGVPTKLVMHMPRRSSDGTLDLETVGQQLDLPMGEHWTHTDALFQLNHRLQGEDVLNKLYNAADLVLTTTRGEGWGLSLTEGLAAGCTIACPTYTSCGEIADEVERLGMKHRFLRLTTADDPDFNHYDLSRMRGSVNSVMSATTLQTWRYVTPQPDRSPLNDKVRNWLDWDRIAKVWWNHFKTLKSS